MKKTNFYLVDKSSFFYGGERGIRTLGTRFSRTHDFQSCSFDHSDISPNIKLLNLTALVLYNIYFIFATVLNNFFILRHYFLL